MEMGTTEAARHFNTDAATIRARVKAGILTGRIVSGQGPAGRVLKVEVPDAQVRFGEDRPAVTAPPAGHIALKQAVRSTGIRYGRLVSNCYRGLYPSAVKVLVGRQERWYVSRADLGLGATQIAPTPTNPFDAVAPKITAALQEVFEAGYAAAMDTVIQRLGGLNAR